MTGFAHLLSPGRIGDLELRNRILMCPMGDNLAHEDGTVSDLQGAYFEARARGGAALLLVGSVSVMYPRGSFHRCQTAASQDRFVAGLAGLAQRVHRHGALVAAQLVHDGGTSLHDIERGVPVLVPSVPRPGRMDGTWSHTTPAEMAAFTSAYASPTSKLEYHEATATDLDEVIAAFAAAAQRCVEAGFDAIELHAGHGYLIDAFLSPFQNRREDDWGGPLEHRARLLVEVLSAVRVAVAVPVWIRLNARELYREPGETLDDAVAVARLAEAAGAAAIHVSSYAEPGMGVGFTESHTPHVAGARLADAAVVRAAVTVPVITYGRLEPEAAERAVAEGVADFVAMGRKLLADPDLPNKLAQGRVDDIRPCIYQYRCIGNIFVRESLACVANAATAHGDEASVPPAGRPRHVLVVGGGPAGMEAARLLAGSGHRVTLCEADVELGGVLRHAARSDEALDRFLGWLRRGVSSAGVEIRLGCPVDASVVAEVCADEIVVATGRTWSGLGIEPATADVTIIGRGVAALRLAGRWQAAGHQVTVMDEAAQFGTELGLPGRFRMIADLETAGVVLRPGSTEAPPPGAFKIGPGEPVRPDLGGGLRGRLVGDAAGPVHGIEQALAQVRSLVQELAR